VLALPAALVVVVLLVQGLHRGPTLDASVFAQIAEQLRAGDVPYRDVFDHKPPGIYLVEAAVGVTIGGLLDAWTRAWAVTLAAGLATLALLARALGPRWPLGTALALLAASPMIGAQYFAQGGGETESLAILPATAGFLVAVGTPRPSARRAFVAGLLIGCANATSFQFLPAAAACLVAFVAGGRASRPVLAYVGGGLALAAVLLAWLGAAGALPAAIDQLVAYNRSYVQSQNILGPIPLVTAALALLAVSPLGAGATVRLARVVRAPLDDMAGTVAATWLGGWVVFIVVQGQFIGHYATSVAPPLVVLAAPTLDRFRGWLALPRTRRLAGVVVGATIVLPVIAVGSTAPDSARRVLPDAAAAAVERHTPPGSAIFVWGNEPFVYLATGRPPVGRYIYMFPLTNPNFTTEAMVAELLDAWEHDPPSAIVDASTYRAGPSAPPLLGRPAADDLLEPLRGFVRANYPTAYQVGDWTVHVRP
jgi:hypothetical protein